MRVSEKKLHALIEGQEVSVVNNCSNLENIMISGVSTPDKANEDELAWLKPGLKNADLCISKTKAVVIICDEQIKTENFPNKCFLVCSNPRLIFARLMRKLLEKKQQAGVHSTSFIDPEANVHPTVYIGPFCYIGKAKISQGARLISHCYIADNVVLGENVTIGPGCKIGQSGFGYVTNPLGIHEEFMHVGGVIIEANVDIGANSCIDCGALGPTIISQGTKIDNLCHIAHNVKVGNNCLITACTEISGSVEIGDNSWMSPSSTVLNGIHLGENSFIGIGSVVIKDVPDDHMVLGAPSRSSLRTSLGIPANSERQASKLRILPESESTQEVNPEVGE